METGSAAIVATVVAAVVAAVVTTVVNQFGSVILVVILAAGIGHGKACDHCAGCEKHKYFFHF